MKTYIQPLSASIFTGERPMQQHASKWQLDSAEKVQIKDGDPTGDLDAKHSSFQVWEED